MNETALLLDNIRSVHNVGSIFRTAEGAGVSRIYCLGTTPVPLDRFGRKRADFAKVALGAEGIVPWEHIDDALRLIRALKKDGFYIVAVEQDKRSVSLRDLEARPKTLFILGNEVGGIDMKILKAADVIAEIPLEGKKQSLNVSVVAGIALFARLTDDRGSA